MEILEVGDILLSKIIMCISWCITIQLYENDINMTGLCCYYSLLLSDIIQDVLSGAALSHHY